MLQKIRFVTKKTYIVQIVLLVFFVVGIFYPLWKMLSTVSSEDFTKVVMSPVFFKSLKNSVVIATISMIFSVLLGFTLALCIQRTNIHFKFALSILLILPMCIPSVSHGIALTVLFGSNGIITNLFNINSILYEFNGIILASVLYSYPIAFLMLNDALRYEDFSYHEAALVLGIPLKQRFCIITLPYLKKTICAAAFAVFTLVITDYGIPLMIGGKYTTLATMMYEEVLGQLNFGKGSVIGLFLLIPAFATFIVNFVSNTKLKTIGVKKFNINRNRLRDCLAYLFCGVIVLFIILFTYSLFIMAFTKNYPYVKDFTFENFYKIFNFQSSRFLINSLVVAFLVGVIGTVVAFISAYMSARVHSKMSYIFHLLSTTSLAIPGIVLGLSYAMTFSKSCIYDTVVIVIIANLIHFFASPYLLMYNLLSSLNENLEAVGKTLGINTLRVIFRVIIPQSKFTLLEMFSYFFVNSMITISAVSFLTNTSTKLLALLINQFEAQLQLNLAATVSVTILSINILVKFVVYLFRHSN